MSDKVITRDEHGTSYYPYVSDGLIGLRAVKADGSVSYIYLVPSDDDDAGKSNVFLYQGPIGDPTEDSPVVYTLV